jgi:cytochrome b561
MGLKNTTEKFGSLTKLLHWVIFGLFVLQYFLVYRREYFPKESAEKLQYMLLHKSIGVCLLVIALVMLLWRHAGTRPTMPKQMSGLEAGLARFIHLLLYIVMLVMPISGILMSMFGGYNISVFGWYTLPMLFQKNEALGNIMYTTHVWSSYAIIGLVGLHALAALYHHFIKHDNILKRMLPSS